ncbi:NAD(P)H-binding protein [Rhizobium leguminosarum]|uniref:NAD(P)H-binding protein n=1 Tax=Rhizobium leguminosarum TaxID=384 RepID=UPI0021BBF3D5|nr:NAD(P)H-binding protein [Rhizobium leguminosarum]
MKQLKTLAIGATGSVGRLVVTEASTTGHTVRAVVRNASRAARLPAVEIAVGDVTGSDTLAPALDKVDALVLTVNAKVKARRSPSWSRKEVLPRRIWTRCSSGKLSPK